MPDLAIIGAGPIGLEAALAAANRGWNVRVYEQREIAANVHAWGHVRMFSPFGMNASPEGIARLQACGFHVPGPEELLTGADFALAYLEPLAACLGAMVETHTTVTAIGRCRTHKHEKIGDETRMDHPFRLLLQQGDCERTELADVVLDCSGTFNSPKFLGDGGIPAVGERACRAEIDYGVPDVFGKQRHKYERRRILVVGGGHSAATVVRDLAKVAESILWITREPRPWKRIANDPLPAREELMAAVEALVVSGKVEHRPGRTVLVLTRRDTRLLVQLSHADGEEMVEADRIVAAVGFRPNLELARELQAKTCYATEGTFNLAAALLGETAGDCLALGCFGPETLLHPEPGYFVLGMKSYGRSPDFLLQTGRQQIADALLLAEKWKR